MSRELYGSGDTADKVQNLMNSLGNMGSFLYNTTPLGRVADTFSRGMEKARADRLAGKPIPSLRKFGMGLKGGMEADPKPMEHKTTSAFRKEVSDFLALKDEPDFGGATSKQARALQAECKRRKEEASASGMATIEEEMEGLEEKCKNMAGTMAYAGKGRMGLKGGCWECRGGGPIPDRNILQQLATQSYQAVPATRIGQLELVRATPTLKFYRDNGNTIVVAIRGTKPTDVDDVSADGLIAIGQLETSKRYKEDLNTIQQFQVQFPPSQYDYYGVGHSLGGAILDSFLKRGLIKNGVSYNPAVQPQDFQNTTLPNQRVYMESDPLYALMGRNLAKKPETRAPRKKSWWEKAASYIPYASTAVKGYDLYQSHMLDQFQGGAKAHSKFETQLRKVGIEPSLYLKEAQRRAKNAGLPYKVLGFADDGDHKLSIPNADGRMIKFGKVGYGDHLIWSHLERAGSAPKGTADAKRSTFRKSHSAIKGDWKKDPFSPNSLALSVLWA